MFVSNVKMDPRLTRPKEDDPSIFPDRCLDWIETVTENSPDLTIILLIVVLITMLSYIIVFINRLVMSIGSTLSVILVLVLVIHLHDPTEQVATAVFKTILANASNYLVSITTGT